MGRVWRGLAWSVARAPAIFTSAFKIRMDCQIGSFPKEIYLRPLGDDPSITSADQRMLTVTSGTQSRFPSLRSERCAAPVDGSARSIASAKIFYNGFYPFDFYQSCWVISIIMDHPHPHLRLDAEGWRLHLFEAGEWTLEARSWRLEPRGWRLEVRGWRL